MVNSEYAGQCAAGTKAGSTIETPGPVRGGEGSACGSGRVGEPRMIGARHALRKDAFAGHKGKTPDRTAPVLVNNRSRNIRFPTRWRAGSDAIERRTSHDARCSKYFLR